VESNSKSINVPTSNIKESIYLYLESISFIHKITANKELLFLAEIIYNYFDLAKNVKDETLINRLLFDTNTAAKIVEAVGIDRTRYYALITKFEEKGIIVDKKLRKGILPKIHNDTISTNITFTIKENNS